MSKMLPLVAARDLSLALGGSALQGAKAQRFVDIAVAKLANHQHEDGMFSLWPNSEALPHLTAYAVWALHQAERSGVALPKQVVQRGLDALTGWANQQATLAPDGNTAALSLAVYVAAERKKPMRAIATRLYTQRATLPVWARAFLWRAFAKTGAPARQLEELRASVVNSIASTPQSAFIEDVAMHDPSHMGSRVRATAMVLDALVALAPQDPLVAKLAHGLLAHRDRAGAWETTQDNVWSLVALANYAKALGAAPANATVMLDGKPVALPKSKSGAAVTSLALPATQVNGKSLKVTSAQAVNAVLRLRAVQPGAPHAQANGFVVARRYLNRAGNAVTQAQAGELLTVEVTVTTRADAPFVAIIDPLPMGLEPVNPRLGPTAARRSDRTENESFDDEGDADGDNWWVTYAELRDDRAQWFVNHMDKGEQTLTYQVRATTPGRFFVPPAMAEQMYAPTVNGRSAALTFTVTGR